MAEQLQPIFDLYVTNIKRLNDIQTTRDELEKFLNKFLIEKRFNELFGVVKLIKIPYKARFHSGSTVTAFVRLTKPDQHEGAAIMMENLTFMGKTLRIKVNEVSSQDDLWLKANDKYKNIWLHGEKIKYLRALTADVEIFNPNELAKLKNELENSEATVKNLEKKLDHANAKINQLNRTVEKLSIESREVEDRFLDTISEKERTIKALREQAKKRNNHFIGFRPKTATSAELYQENKRLNQQVESLTKALKKEIESKSQ